MQIKSMSLSNWLHGTGPLVFRKGVTRTEEKQQTSKIETTEGKRGDKTEKKNTSASTTVHIYHEPTGLWGPLTTVCIG